jgi:prophage regulatory protein
MLPATTADHSAPTPRKTRVSGAATAVIDATGKGDKKPTRGAIVQPLEAASLPDALLKIQTVATVTALSASSIFRKTAAGEFPEPIRLGARCTRWRAADVRAWLAAQVAG